MFYFYVLTIFLFQFSNSAIFQSVTMNSFLVVYICRVAILLCKAILTIQY